MIAEMFKAAARAVEALSRGESIATPPEIVEERKAHCEGCIEFSGRRCHRCGCFMDVKWRIATEQCPLDPPKWGAVVVKKIELP